MRECKTFTDYEAWLSRVKELGATVFLPVSNGRVAQTEKGVAVGLWSPNKTQGKGWVEK